MLTTSINSLSVKDKLYTHLSDVSFIRHNSPDINLTLQRNSNQMKKVMPFYALANTSDEGKLKWIRSTLFDQLWLVGFHWDPNCCSQSEHATNSYSKSNFLSFLPLISSKNQYCQWKTDFQINALNDIHRINNVA